eukprot:1320310-Alexandrium_andersonii.AAC.1
MLPTPFRWSSNLTYVCWWPRMVNALRQCAWLGSALCESQAGQERGRSGTESGAGHGDSPGE